MAARAMWKAVIQCGQSEVPVKLYSAIEDRNIHFRVLSRKDKQPVHGAMVNPETGKIVPHAETRRAYVADNGDRAILDASELTALEPEPSRNIDIVAFLPNELIDHHWYDRPYYLGPDGNGAAYFAFTEAIESSALQGLARWVMRGKAYMGALRLHQGYPLLMSLKLSDEVVAVENLEAPGGAVLNPKELDMARQLIGMLAAELDLSAFQDAYRDRVLNLVKAKAEGGPRLKLVKGSPKKPSDDLERALHASLKSARKSA
ncbi:Ku protein [Haliea sp. E1-2-M8]|uniref:non-homologous end joining protein Ku n=1 Tax=Haliea sp. E1-2-M8 TaxID=3064706 RepID=UPI00271AD1C5|nr:Ku protein [Haliea sp. E1-2-M8]MDO8863553.1 Ku protein [Haliea sp. E1-2-M8]